MKIVIIGSGNVATHLAKALFAAKQEVIQIWSYHLENARLLATQVNAKAIDELADIDLTAEICLIAVKDDAISEIVHQLSAFKGIIAHTAGSVGLDVFANQFDQYGVLYPLQTFSKSKNVDFTTVPICLEANEPDSYFVLSNLAHQMSKHVVKVNSEKRKILHLAAVFACNFPNHLYALAEKILEKHELDFDILRPLILETALKVQENLPKTVQTGPAVRNDQETLIKHEALLAEDPQGLEIYRTLSESIKKTR